ncbi:MAG: hypothetical protein M1820_008235 [Bogoriella megaspora]|nr:MAG: hypothetical protein M1820_008235 [Bogoriella megaspora]
MQWVGYAELASAVSNAGGLGILTALTQPTPEDLRKEIAKCKTLTPHPFGVNLTLLPALQPPDYPAYARVIISSGIRIVETAGNSPGPVIKLLKEAGCTILHKCTTIRHAQSAVKLGVDFLSIDGFECAGHVGESDITNFILLSRARQSLGVPFIASGGFADGQGLAAALSLGAEGINMGTRFMCTVEAPIHVNIKEAIVAAQETDTELVLRRWRNTSRLFSNKVAKEAVKVEKESTSGKFEDVAPFVSGKRGREVFLNGDKDFGVWTAGQVIGLIHDIPTCEELIRRIEREATETLRKASSLFVQDSGKQPVGVGGTVGKNVNNPEAELWGIGKKGIMFPHLAELPDQSPSSTPTLLSSASQSTPTPPVNLHSALQAPQPGPPLRISPYVFTKLNERLAFSLTSPPPSSESSFAQKLVQERNQIKGEICERLRIAICASMEEGDDRMHNAARRRTRGYKRSNLSSMKLARVNLEEEYSTTETTMMRLSEEAEDLPQGEAVGSSGAGLAKRKRNDSLLSRVFENVKRRKSKEDFQERLQERLQGLREQIEVLTGNGWEEGAEEDGKVDLETENGEEDIFAEDKMDGQR